MITKLQMVLKEETITVEITKHRMTVVEVMEEPTTLQLVIDTTTVTGEMIKRSNLFKSNKCTWEGDKNDVGAVLRLRTKSLDKKVSFRVFIEKMIECILRNLNNASGVLPLLSKRKYPLPIFRTNHMPGELSNAEKTRDALVAIQQQRIKKFVEREIEVDSSVKKIYGLIKGQCFHSLCA